MNEQKIRAHFKRIDPIIHSAMEEIDFSDWLEPRNSSDYFVSICREIIGQQLSGKVASTITGRFRKLFGRKKVSPKNTLTFSDQELRDVGMSWAKVKYVKDLAEKTLNGDINLENLDELNDEDVRIELIKVKGIGPWTAEMFLIFTLGREDVFSHGDLGLRRGLEKLYRLKDPSEEQINKIVSPWSPYKTYGSITLWHSLDSK